jgi:hypothetical protein
VKGLIWKKSSYLNLESPNFKEVVLSKPTQLPQGNNVLDAPVSSKDGFLSRDICVSSSYLDRPIWDKRFYLDIEKLELLQVFHS